VVPFLHALNVVCPYYTMFPLDFPLRILKRYARKGNAVLDPYCGRGTANFAARLCGLRSCGIDSSPVAAALADAKLRFATTEQVMRAARRILQSTPRKTYRLPRGEFWRWAFHQETLDQLCRLRAGLRRNCRSDARIILRAIILGALHGPLTKSAPSYFSNQCPRTFAPKPRYAVNFWKHRRLDPPRVDVLDVIRRRSRRYLAKLPPRGKGTVIRGDSRKPEPFGAKRRFDWVITSPPYYGMRTYIPDQWLRHWFLGGPARVDYSNARQLQHTSPGTFVSGLRRVWRNAAAVCRKGARLVVRFGGINDRKQDPLTLLKLSLDDTPWRCQTARAAGNADTGRRQSRQFATCARPPVTEYDVYAILD
jgi:hypothetical protein